MQTLFGNPRKLGRVFRALPTELQWAVTPIGRIRTCAPSLTSEVTLTIATDKSYKREAKKMRSV